MREIRDKKVLAFLVLLFVEGVLLFAYLPVSIRLQETPKTTRSVSLSFVLSLGSPSHEMILDNTTTELDIQRLESNDTDLQIAAYDLSGIFFEISNVTTIQNLTILIVHYGEFNVSFDRESKDANVSVLALVYSTVPGPLTINWAPGIVLGLIVLIQAMLVGALWFLPRGLKEESGRSRPRKVRRSTAAALLLLLCLCVLPISLAFQEALHWHSAFVGYSDSTIIRLNVSHPQDRIRLSPFQGWPVHVTVYNLEGHSVLMSFQIESTTEEFVAKLGQLEIELQNDTTLALTRLNADVNPNLLWISGYMDYGRLPNWSLLLSPFVVVPVSAGFLGAVFVLAAAKRIDSMKRGEQASATEPDS